MPERGLKMTERYFRILAFSIVATPVLFAVLAVLAYMQRGYFAFGGEIMAVPLPLFVFIALCVSD